MYSYFQEQIFQIYEETYNFFFNMELQFYNKTKILQYILMH